MTLLLVEIAAKCASRPAESKPRGSVHDRLLREVAHVRALEAPVSLTSTSMRPAARAFCPWPWRCVPTMPKTRTRANAPMTRALHGFSTLFKDLGMLAYTSPTPSIASQTDIAERLAILPPCPQFPLLLCRYSRPAHLSHRESFHATANRTCVIVRSIP